MRRDPPSNVDPQRPSPELLLWAYRHGLFPMAEPDTDRIDWFSPDPRGILPLDGFHVPHSLARLVRQGRFEITTDQAFEQVMRVCAQPRFDGDETWISETLLAAYCRLHESGHAHSVEARRESRLVGGLYGVSIGGVFFGESMFTRPEIGGTDSSKVCLVHLVERLRRGGFQLLDTQFWNPHLHQFGCIEIPQEEYLQRLTRAIELPARWNPGSES